jgi:hypothetical protein
MANSLTQNQLYTVLNSIAAQATGNAGLTATDTSSFVTVADVTLKSGYDNVISAISQVLSRTIFSNRPYTRKFRSLETDRITFGNHVRKLAIADKDWESDERLPLTEGQSIDMYKVSKPNILQTNFYGQEVYQRHYTLFKDQLDVAFSNETEFARFVAMVVQNCSDIIEQAHESLSRSTVVNAIAGIIALNNSSQIVHLLTEYNTLTGLSLDAQSVYEPDNFKAFIQWAYARMATVSDLLTERSEIFHNNISGKEIKRHTPKEMQRAYIYAPTRNMIDSMVYANTFNDRYLRGVEAESVSFWQSIKDPTKINVKCGYTDNTGVPATDTVTEDNIFALIFDREMMGMTVVNQWSAQTPFNAAGGYSNVYFHFTDRYYNDNFENAVLFLLD